MSLRPHRSPVDADRLARYLKVLSEPSRILLLQKLQVPQAPSELSLPATRRSRHYAEDRPLSLQAVIKHIDRLEHAGLVRGKAATREGQPVTEYHVHQPRLFSLVEDLRQLALIRPAPSVVGPGQVTGDATAAAEAEPTAPILPDGPALVLVSGPMESKAFPLEGPGPWTVGRARSNDVALDYDPFVSGANAVIHREGEGFILVDEPSSRNGTMHNWAMLPNGGEVRLGPGDTVGVGRSLLVFRNGSNG